MGKPCHEKKLTPEQEKALKIFNETGDSKWLDAEQRDKINMARLAEGTPLLIEKFGAFAEDRADLARVAGVAASDYQFISGKMAKNIRAWQTGTEEHRENVRKRLRIVVDSGNEWPEEASADFAQWVVGYLQHAGYLNPQFGPTMWKQVIMTAFPPLTGGLDIGIEETDFVNNPVPVWLRVDRWFRSYLKLEQMNKQEVEGLSRLRVAQLTVAGC